MIERIVCLTAETTEIAFALGAGDRIVGVSGFAVHPPEARKKTRIGGYSSVDLEKIISLAPDLVLAYSDLQAQAATELIRRGFNVLCTNQRSLLEIAEAILLIGGAIGRGEAAQILAGRFMERVEEVRRAEGPEISPRVYFEEWDGPMICGIRWVSECIEAAGGRDVFAERSRGLTGSERRVTDEEVIAADPQIILASWCGKKVNIKRIAQRPGWERVAAVREGGIHEIKSARILQPGPSLVEGLEEMAKIIKEWGRVRKGVHPFPPHVCSA